MKTLRIAVVAAGIAVAVAAGIAYGQREKADSIASHRAAMLAVLKDPGSATFRNERLDRGIICGEVNARNSSGGYIGYKRYVSTPTRYALEEHGVQGWVAQGDAETIAKRTERATAFLRANGRMPTQEEDNQAEFEAVWRSNCAL